MANPCFEHVKDVISVPYSRMHTGKTPCFTQRNTAFCIAKGILSHRQRMPFTKRNTQESCTTGSSNKPSHWQQTSYGRTLVLRIFAPSIFLFSNNVVWKRQEKPTCKKKRETGSKMPVSRHRTSNTILYFVTRNQSASTHPRLVFPAGSADTKPILAPIHFPSRILNASPAAVNFLPSLL